MNDNEAIVHGVDGGDYLLLRYLCSHDKSFITFHVKFTFVKSESNENV